MAPSPGRNTAVLGLRPKSDAVTAFASRSIRARKHRRIQYASAETSSAAAGSGSKPETNAAEQSTLAL